MEKEGRVVFVLLLVVAAGSAVRRGPVRPSKPSFKKMIVVWCLTRDGGASWLHRFSLKKHNF